MLPGTSRGVTLWYAIFANASTTRLVLASPSRRLPSTTPAFLSGSTRVSSIGSTNSLNTKGEALWSRDDLSRSSPSASFEIWRSQRSPWYQGWVHSSQQTSPAASRSGPVTCNRPVVRTTRSCSALSGAAGLSEETSRVSAEADAVRDHSEDTAAVVAGVGDEAERMKVTLLSGFLGAGKTTLMKNVLRQAKEERLSLAVIVNDMADVNIDAQLLAARDGAGADFRSVSVEQPQQGDEKFVAMQDGCICCTLLDDLLLEVETIARGGKHQHLIIESTGISDPTPVAEALAMSDESANTFDAVDDGGESESLARTEGDATTNGGTAGGGGDGAIGESSAREASFSLDTLVTVVDATCFLDEVRRADDLQERGLEAGEGDTRTIADLLLAQVEFANVILLNKSDLAEEADLVTLEAVVRQLNPAARVMRTVSSDVGLAEVMGTGEFDLDEASQAAGWVKALNDKGTDDQAATAPVAASEGDDEHRHDTYGIGSFTFRARRPFHPERLLGFVMEHLPSVLRSKGFLWLATRHDTAGVWNQAGGSFATEYGGSWDDDQSGDTDADTGLSTASAGGAKAAVVADDSDDDRDDRDHGVADANTRHNELVFIGLGMDEAALTAELRSCLLTDEEMAGGPEAWGRMPDPFPPWQEETGEDFSVGNGGDAAS